VLAAAPGDEREGERKRLAPVRIDLLAKIEAGVGTFLAAGADRAYCGDPASATAEEGRERIEQLADVVVLSAREAWPDLFA
jgi:creatinine amidohydrolase